MSICLSQSRRRQSDSPRRVGLRVNLHAPLPPEFRVTEWVRDHESFRSRFAPMIRLLGVTGSGQPEPPRIVLHAAAGRPELTAEYLEWLIARADPGGLGSKDFRGASRPCER